jgi:hypothetical protein
MLVELRLQHFLGLHGPRQKVYGHLEFFIAGSTDGDGWGHAKPFRDTQNSFLH